MRAHILGTGRSLPSRVVTNEEIASRVDTTDAWIRDKLGVVERRFAADDEQTSDLAGVVARRVLE
jgi:3-oxoacyl-[acyl-carrier-protein] synthase III